MSDASDKHQQAKTCSAIELRNNAVFILPLLVILTWFSNDSLFALDTKSLNTFTNPVVSRGADPWVIRWEGNYLLCQSRMGSLWVNKSLRLQDIGETNWVRVWTPPSDTAYSVELWAPELHYLQGRWYIYVAADDGDNTNHRTYVLEGDSQDPQGSYTFKGKIAASEDRWAIDGTVLTMPDKKLYFLWSGWLGSENDAQNLYIAPMSNPWTISGERVCISKPDYLWERQGYPLVNEGPQVLWNSNKLFIIYSASGSWGDDYCLGQLTLSCTNVLDPKSWIKKSSPVFSRTKDVFGPGHCSFVKSRDGKEDWIVYHAAKFSNAGWYRDIRMQRFNWLPDGSPNLGIPVSPGIPLPEPSGDSTAEKATAFSTTN